MSYENFKEQFIKDIKEELAEKGMDAVNITTQEIQKLNEKYDAITITPEDSRVGVNMNLENFYNISKESNYSEVVNRAVTTIENAIAQMPPVDLESLTNYEQMKEKLTMEVVSAETNINMLESVPHQNIEDMAIVYRFVVEDTIEGRASVVVTNSMIESYGITAEQLHADAMKNAPEIKPAVIQGMTEMMAELMGDEFADFGITIDPADEMMFVASTPDRIYGAGVIAYQEFMDNAAEKLGGDFFVLPSSIHEVLLIKDDGLTSAETLKNMVQEVNETQVLPEEKLTDNVYHYDSKQHVFELADKFEARKFEKNKQIDKKVDKHSSILTDLKEKKKTVVKDPTKEIKDKVTKSKGGESI